jgi:hypothetical protein
MFMILAPLFSASTFALSYNPDEYGVLVGAITLAFVDHYLGSISLASVNHCLPCLCYQTLTLYSFLPSFLFRNQAKMVSEPQMWLTLLLASAVPVLSFVALRAARTML